MKISFSNIESELRSGRRLWTFENHTGMRNKMEMKEIYEWICLGVFEVASKLTSTAGKGAISGSWCERKHLSLVIDSPGAFAAARPLATAAMLSFVPPRSFRDIPLSSFYQPVILT